MSVRVTDYTPKIKASTQVKISLFLRYLLDSIESYSEPITPKDQGPLRDSTQKRVLGHSGQIAWVKRYAAPQEKGVVGRNQRPVRKYTTPGTGPKYAEKGVRKAVINAGAPLKKAGLI